MNLGSQRKYVANTNRCVNITIWLTVYKNNFMMSGGILFLFAFSMVSMAMGEQYSTLFTSPLSNNVDKSYLANSLTISTVKQSWQCTLLCYATENCVAVNIGPCDADGNRKCELKHHLVSLDKWTVTRAGFSYFHIGKIKK